MPRALKQSRCNQKMTQHTQGPEARIENPAISTWHNTGMLNGLCAHRERRDLELQSLQHAKEADVVRLRAEIGRMRAAYTQMEQLNSAHATEVQALHSQLQQLQVSQR